jgi:hypothetical protein
VKKSKELMWTHRCKNAPATGSLKQHKNLISLRQLMDGTSCFKPIPVSRCILFWWGKAAGGGLVCFQGAIIAGVDGSMLVISA